MASYSYSYPWPHTHTRTLGLVLKGLPMPMVSYSYPYPWPHTHTSTHGLILRPTYAHGLVLIPVPMASCSYPYPMNSYSYPYPWSRTRTRTHDLILILLIWCSTTNLNLMQRWNMLAFMFMSFNSVTHDTGFRSHFLFHRRVVMLHVCTCQCHTCTCQCHICPNCNIHLWHWQCYSLFYMPINKNTMLKSTCQVKVHAQ